MENYVMIIDPTAKDKFRDNAQVIENLCHNENFVRQGNSVFGLADTVPVGERSTEVGLQLIRCVTDSVTVLTFGEQGVTRTYLGPVSTSL